MKSSRLLWASALVILSLASCKKDDDTAETVKLADTDIYGTIVTDPVIDADGTVLYTPSLSSDDSIKVFFGASRTAIYNYDSGSSTTAMFTTEDTGSYTASSTVTYFFKGLYPYKTTASSAASETITLNLPAKPEAATAITSDLIYMIGRSKDENISMRNTCSYLRFSVATEGITSVSLASHDNSDKLCGRATISFDDSGIPEVTDTVSGSNQITAYAPDGGTFVPGKKYYVAVYPCSLTSGYTILYHTPRGYYTVDVPSSSLAFVRNRVTAISQTESGATFTSACGGMSVDEDGHMIYLATGNLQYDLTAKKWSIASRQYDFIGNEGGNTDMSTKGTADLFGWSTDATSSNWGLYTVEDATDGYTSGSFKDWGANLSGNWTTLSREDFRYILDSRTCSKIGKTENARYIKATVADIPGIIIFPDVFTWPAELEKPEKINSYSADFTVNVYTAFQFEYLDSCGAAFLPAAGYRSGTSVYNCGLHGYYWTSDEGVLETCAYSLDFSNYSAAVNSLKRCQGYSVRLATSFE